MAVVTVITTLSMVSVPGHTPRGVSTADGCRTGWGFRLADSGHAV